MKRTLERELKVPEIAKREANGTSFSACRLLASKGNFSSARAVDLIWTSSVPLGLDCHRALGVRGRSRGSRVFAAVMLVSALTPLP